MLVGLLARSLRRFPLLLALWLDAVMGLPPVISEAGRLSLRVMVCGTGSERLGPKHHRGTAMDHYVGIDVSLELSSLCVLDAAGQIVREAKVASEPEALIGFLTGLALPLARIGLEAGPLSQCCTRRSLRRVSRRCCWRRVTSR